MHIRSPKSIAGLGAAILGTALALMHNVSAATVELPAGSADGLTVAIAAAGPGGTVLVQEAARLTPSPLARGSGASCLYATLL